MTRRKREITGLANEQDFPHLVELAPMHCLDDLAKTCAVRPMNRA